MKQDRKSVYSRNDTCRVISVSGGMWQLQQLGGTNSTREHDPWFNRGEPSDFETAHKNMGN